MDVLFRTPHGSHLYGLAHENSDRDYYTVVAKKPYTGRGQGKAKYSKQTIVDGLDSVVVDFGTWVEQCRSGVPQACEAMFSNQAEVDKVADFRRQFRLGTEAWPRYLRTIKSFAYSETDEYKRKRHALRLALNFNALSRAGRFNPTLSPALVVVVSSVAEMSPDEVYKSAMYLAWGT